MYVSDWMSTRLVTISDGEGVERAKALMAERRIRHLPVLRDGKLIGVVSDRDLTRRPGAAAAPDRGGHHMTPTSVGTVGALVHEPPIVVAPGHEIAWAAGLMYAHRIGSLPVVGEDRRLVGMLTSTDVLRCFSETLGFGNPADREILALGRESPPLWKQLRDIEQRGKVLVNLVLFRSVGSPPVVLLRTKRGSASAAPSVARATPTAARALPGPDSPVQRHETPPAS